MIDVNEAELREQIAKEIEGIMTVAGFNNEYLAACYYRVKAAEIARGSLRLRPPRLPDGHQPVNTETARGEVK